MDNKNQMQFLNYAITDISNYIRFIDTKVTLVLTFSGVLLNVFITLRDNLSCLIESQLCILSVISSILVIGMLISMAAMIIWGLQTIKVRVGRLDYKSKWFFKPCECNFNGGFESYSSEVRQMKDDDITENMAAELYKLNDIYLKKMECAKYTVESFKWFVLISFTMLALLIWNVTVK